jgi:hypothetical protein
MTQYRDHFNKKQKTFNVSYHLAKHGWGRISPAGSLSLCVFHRPTRHTLCEGKYADLDMTNCQPQIMLEKLRHAGIKKDYLEKYVKDPKKYRAKIMEHHGCTKDVAKNLAISIMFGGKYDSWLVEHNITTNNHKKLETMHGLEQDMREIIEIVYHANKDTIVEAVKQQDKSKKKKNKEHKMKWATVEEEKRGTMGLWAQSVERLLQETAIKWLVENSFII